MTSLPEFVDWFTVKEIANHLRVSKMTVYRAIETGELAASKFAGRNFRVSRDALEDYMKRCAS